MLGLFSGALLSRRDEFLFKPVHEERFAALPFPIYTVNKEKQAVVMPDR